MEWADELQRITAVAMQHGIDPLFIAAIRKQENGRPQSEGGAGEFGVSSIPAPTYDDQLNATVKTVRNRLVLYGTNPLTMMETAAGYRRLLYKYTFIQALAAAWAPVGASNDPHGLNVEWPANVNLIYHQLIEQDAEGANDEGAKRERSQGGGAA